MAGELHAAEGLFTFRQRHAHSWVEISLEGQGWVICEFTPESNAEPGQGGPGAVAAAPKLDAFTDVNTPPPTLAAADVEVSTPDFFAQLGRLWPALADTQTRNVLLMVALGFAVLLWWKRTDAQRSPEEKARRAAAARDLQPAYVQELRDLATAAGLTFNPGDTVKELRRTLQTGGCDHPELATLTNYHYAVRYEDAPEDRRQESEFVSFLKTFRTEWTRTKPQA
jgi:hypothetical protein